MNHLRNPGMGPIWARTSTFKTTQFSALFVPFGHAAKSLRVGSVVYA